MASLLRRNPFIVRIVFETLASQQNSY